MPINLCGIVYSPTKDAVSVGLSEIYSNYPSLLSESPFTFSSKAHVSDIFLLRKM